MRKRSQHDPDRSSLPTPPTTPEPRPTLVLVARHTVGFKERGRGRPNQLRLYILPKALLCSTPLPSSEFCREDGIRWEPPRGCGDLLEANGQRLCLGRILGARGVTSRKKHLPYPRRWRGTVDPREGVRGYSRNGEQVRLPQGWEGSDRRVGSSRCSGDGYF